MYVDQNENTDCGEDVRIPTSCGDVLASSSFVDHQHRDENENEYERIEQRPFVLVRLVT